MYKQLNNTLSAISKDQQLHLLAGGRIGLEKECLRVGDNGLLSTTTSS